MTKYASQIQAYDPLVIIDEQGLKQGAERKTKEMHEVLNKRFFNAGLYNKPVNTFSINLKTAWRYKKSKPHNP